MRRHTSQGRGDAAAFPQSGKAIFTSKNYIFVYQPAAKCE